MRPAVVFSPEPWSLRALENLLVQLA